MSKQFTEEDCEHGQRCSFVITVREKSLTMSDWHKSKNLTDKGNLNMDVR